MLRIKQPKLIIVVTIFTLLKVITMFASPFEEEIVLEVGSPSSCEMNLTGKDLIQTHSELLEVNHSENADMSRDSKVIQEEIRPFWEPHLFTDPQNHDPKNFIYIIRVGNIYGKYLNGAPIDPMAQTLREIQGENYISASLIGRLSEEVEFFGIYPGRRTGLALILRVPSDAIHVATPKDTGRMAKSDQRQPQKSRLIKDEEHFGMHTPRSLIYESQLYAEKYNLIGTHYNEILFVGSKRVEVIGLAVFGDLTNQAIEASNNLKIPIVEIR
jgi:hypothetical protein